MPVSASAASGKRKKRPNVVVVMTDDQTFESLDRMPYVSGRHDWVRFENAFLNTPICCPSRATLLSGRYSHRHGVETNFDGRSFDDRSTLATWLQDAGYRTAFFGKYLNGYPWSRRSGRYVPRGWDRWTAFRGLPGYYDYRINRKGPSRRRAKTVERGSGRRDYSTDLLARKAIRFVRKAGERRRPFLVLLAPFAPHGPLEPAQRHAAALSGTTIRHPPNLNEEDVSDKPGWVRERTPRDPERMAERRLQQYRMLLSVDEAVRGIFRALNRTGRLRDTAIVYLSDNGFNWGEHRLTGKACAYEECVRTPLLIRFPGVEPRTEEALVSNVDLAPTVARWARVRPPRDVDGRSLIKLLRGKRDRLRGALLLHGRRPDPPHGERQPATFWAVRNQRFKYVETEGTGERELYDLRRDPHELVNRVDRPAYARAVADLDARLDELREG